MTDVARLKSSKGLPPPLEAAPSNVTKPPREKQEPQVPIQVFVPESIAEAFAVEAAKLGGRGPKRKLFLQMWDEHCRRRGAL